MARRTTPFELMLPVRDSVTPAYRWLYTSLRSKILEGWLRPGARLPGTRDLARQYGLSRGTVVYAFEQLKSEGYVDGSVGSGTYVSKVLPDELLQVRRKAYAQTPVQPKQRRSVSDYGRRVSPFPIFEICPTRAFRPHVPQ